MCIKNRWASLAFKFIALCCGLYGVLLQLGFIRGSINLNALNYYTLLSNVVCIVYFFSACILLLLRPDKPFAPRFKGAVVMCITVTGLIFHFLLAGGTFHMSGNDRDVANLMVHYVVPIMTVLDWVLFDKKGVYRVYDPILWLCMPLAYLAYTEILALTGHTFGSSRYPYFFLDVDKIGVGSVALYVVALIAVFLALGYVIYFVDKWLSGGFSGKRRK